MGAEESKQYRELYSPTVTDPAQIQSYLYLSGENIAKDPVILQKVGITHILNLSRNIISNTNGQKIIRKNITIDDRATENIRQHFDDAFRFIDEARARNGRVLVHCAMGISRSTTIVIAYLMLRYRMPLDATYAYVKTRRPIIRPNPGFMDQLREYDNDLRRNNVYKNTNFMNSLPFAETPNREPYNRPQTPTPSPKTPAPPGNFQNQDSNYNANNNNNINNNNNNNNNNSQYNIRYPQPQQQLQPASYNTPPHYNYNNNHRHQHHQHSHHQYTYNPYANHYANNPYVNRRYSYPYSY